MGGALLQLVAHGQQDVYLTSNPQIDKARQKKNYRLILAETQ